MKSILAFIAICISWTFSWFAIKIQTTSFVSIYVSVFYRMLLAGLILLMLLWLKKQKLKINIAEFKSILAIGIINGCFNFIIVYKACEYVPSGIVATMSATTIFLSEFISCLYYRRRPNLIILLTSITGGLGMLCLFWYNISNQNFELYNFIIGIGLCLIANIALACNFVIIANNYQKNKTSPFLALSYSSLIAAASVFVIIIFLGKKIEFDFSYKYIASLAYVVIFASVIAYSSVYYLNTTIGPAKTGYTALIYTPSSMVISTIYEGWEWHFSGTIGILIIMISVIFGLRAKYISYK